MTGPARARQVVTMLSRARRQLAGRHHADMMGVVAPVAAQGWRRQRAAVEPRREWEQRCGSRRDHDPGAEVIDGWGNVWKLKTAVTWRTALNTFLQVSVEGDVGRSGDTAVVKNAPSLLVGDLVSVSHKHARISAGNNLCLL